MKPQFRKMILRNLSAELSLFQPVAAIETPKGGWLRTIRQALAIPLRYPAHKLGLTNPGYLKLERNEALGTITLNALRKSAEAINCKLVYAVVPVAGSLEAMLHDQAQKQARQTIDPVAHTMLLESQTSHASNERIAELAKQLSDDPRATLWPE
jgi:predicted DNA-binding mobile mystery protein A